MRRIPRGRTGKEAGAERRDVTAARSPARRWHFSVFILSFRTPPHMLCHNQKERRSCFQMYPF